LDETVDYSSLTEKVQKANCIILLGVKQNSFEFNKIINDHLMKDKVLLEFNIKPSFPFGKTLVIQEPLLESIPSLTSAFSKMFRRRTNKPALLLNLEGGSGDFQLEDELGGYSKLEKGVKYHKIKKPIHKIMVCPKSTKSSSKKDDRSLVTKDIDMFKVTALNEGFEEKLKIKQSPKSDYEPFITFQKKATESISAINGLKVVTPAKTLNKNHLSPLNKLKLSPLVSLQQTHFGEGKERVCQNERLKSQKYETRPLIPKLFEKQMAFKHRLNSSQSLKTLKSLHLPFLYMKYDALKKFTNSPQHKQTPYTHHSHTNVFSSLTINSYH
jgi:hypothetical protein